MEHLRSSIWRPGACVLVAALILLAGCGDPGKRSGVTPGAEPSASPSSAGTTQLQNATAVPSGVSASEELVVFAGGETVAVDTATGATRHLQGPLKDVGYLPSPDGAKLIIGCDDDARAYIGGEDTGLCMYTDAGYRQLSRSSDLVSPGLVEDDATQLEGSWSADSTRFAFLVRQKAAQGVYSSGDIYIVDLRGGPVRRVSEGEFAKLRGPLLWSPDGAQIATRNSPRIGSGDELGVIDVATGANRSLAVSTRLGTGQIEQYAWSPDGTKLAFTLNDGATHLYGALADASEIQSLTTAWGGAAPVWSADGAWIAALDVRDAQSILLAVRADGSERREIGLGLHNSSQPVWAPDSTRLAFAASASGDFNDRRLYTAGIGGGAPRRMADETPAFFPQIAFSGDGQRIFYTADAGRCMEGCPPGYLYMTRVEGTSPAVKLFDAPVERFLGRLP